MRKLYLACAIHFAFSTNTYALEHIDSTENIVLQWNDAVLQAVRETYATPPVVARHLAILNTSIFDAWAVFDNKAKGTQLGKTLKAPATLNTAQNKQEAIAYAAFRTANDLFPLTVQKAFFKKLLIQQGYDVKKIKTDKTTAAGIGNLVASKVISFRRNDKSNQLGNLNKGKPYSDWTGYESLNTPDYFDFPNNWQTLLVSDGKGNLIEQEFICPHWGKVTPFGFKEWDKDVVTPVREEVKRRNGRVGPATIDQPEYKEQALQLMAYAANLTDQQKVMAEYWADGPSSELPAGHWNLFAQFVSHRDKHNLDQDVKLFFALSNTLFDTSIALWGAKREFDSVRPISAIVYLFGNSDWTPYQPTDNDLLKETQANTIIDDENSDDTGNVIWRPYQTATFVTPAFPEYPSGHSGFSAAGAEILKRFTGSDVFGYKVTNPAGASRVEKNSPKYDVTLSWATFSDAADEAGMSRRYGGIHFADADLDGRMIGRKVAEIDWKIIQSYFSD